MSKPVQPMYSQEIIAAVFAAIFGLSGVTLVSVGATMQDPLAPLSASFVAGAALFVVMFGTSLGSVTQMAAVLSEGLEGVKFLDQRHYALFAIIVLSSWYGYLGTDLLLRHWPNVLPPTCLDGQWGFQCTNCTCMEGICADGAYGNGKCSCLLGWTDNDCDICADKFECTWRSNEWDIRCSGNHVGEYCLQCAIGYTGDTCTDCDTRYIEQYSQSSTGETTKECICYQGIGPNCLPQPDCKIYDYNGRSGDATGMVPDGNFVPSGVNCDYNEDCSTLWCQGVATISILKKVTCLNDFLGFPCENRQCSVTSRYEDGTCTCSPGFVGPECEPCPGMAPVDQYNPYSPVEREYKTATAFICNGGTCAWQGGSAECTRCPLGWSGEYCQCEGSVGMCTACSPYYFGSECKPCPGVDGAVGVSKWAC
jgi:hypothetical protein